MKYSRFETVILTAGALAVLVNVMLLPPTSSDAVVEVVAQVLLLAVLGAAVHWGRKGGCIATVIASLGYVAMTVPLMTKVPGIDPRIAQLLAVRVITYGIVGILGGELCGHLKYLFARLEDSCNVDAISGLYNQRFMARVLESWIGQHRRYGVTFSVVLLDVPSPAAEKMKPSTHKSNIKSVANHIRNDIRLVDEAGILDDGRYLLLLPHTPVVGAHVVVDRLRDGLNTSLGAQRADLLVSSLSTAADIEAIETLARELIASGANCPA